MVWFCAFHLPALPSSYRFQGPQEWPGRCSPLYWGGQWLYCWSPAHECWCSPIHCYRCSCTPWEWYKTYSLQLYPSAWWKSPRVRGVIPPALLAALEMQQQFHHELQANAFPPVAAATFLEACCDCQGIACWVSNRCGVTKFHWPAWIFMALA